MAPGPRRRKPTRLEELEIFETSGVDRAANLVDGWLVVKQMMRRHDFENDRGQCRTCRLTKAQHAEMQLLRAPARKAEEKPPPAEPPAPPPVAKADPEARLAEILAALEQRCKRMGFKPVPGLQKIAEGALKYEQSSDESVRPDFGDYDDQIKRAVAVAHGNARKTEKKEAAPVADKTTKSGSTTPPPVAPAIPVTFPQAEKARLQRAKDDLAAAEAALAELGRQPEAITRHATVVAAHNRGMSHEEAVSKVVRAAHNPDDATSAQDLLSIAKQLAERTGQSVEAAMGQVAREAVKLRGEQQATALSKAVKTARVTKGLTQEQLAEAVGAGLRSVQYWEAGETAPSGAYLVRLADVLDLDLRTLQ